LPAEPGRRRTVSFAGSSIRFDRIDRSGTERSRRRRRRMVSLYYLRPESLHYMYTHDGLRAVFLVRRLSNMGARILLSGIKLNTANMAGSLGYFCAIKSSSETSVHPIGF